MTPQTENAIRSIVALDPEISPDAIEQALKILRGIIGTDEDLDHVLRPKEAMAVLHVHRRTLDYYLQQGYLVRVYGGGKRAIGISRQSIMQFLRRRVVR